jgi:hypothetical protein
MVITSWAAQAALQNLLAEQHLKPFHNSLTITEQALQQQCVFLGAFKAFSRGALSCPPNRWGDVATS